MRNLSSACSAESLRALASECGRVTNVVVHRYYVYVSQPSLPPSRPLLTPRSHSRQRRRAPRIRLAGGSREGAEDGQWEATARVDGEVAKVRPDPSIASSLRSTGLTLNLLEQILSPVSSAAAVGCSLHMLEGG